MKLTKSDIEHIASLARLKLTEPEKGMYAEQLSVVLDYIDTLREVDTEGVPETCQVTGLEDVVRKDEVKTVDPVVKEKIIAEFPEKMGTLLKVKAVFTAE